jgi:hypothetical protein
MMSSTITKTDRNSLPYITRFEAQIALAVMIAAAATAGYAEEPRGRTNERIADVTTPSERAEILSDIESNLKRQSPPAHF